MRKVGFVMAIMSIWDEKKWEQVEEMVRMILLKRKFRFDRETILEIIKRDLLKEGIEVELLECSYFQILFLNILDNLVKNGDLFLKENIYIPCDYVILDHYDTRNADLLYFSRDKYHQSFYINVETKEKTTIKKDNDFLLTGGISKEDGDSLLVPVIPFSEIASIYQDFIMEGASKEEAILHILNYYPIQVMDSSKENVLAIERKSKHSLKKVLKKDNFLN